MCLKIDSFCVRGIYGVPGINICSWRTQTDVGDKSLTKNVYGLKVILDRLRGHSASHVKGLGLGKFSRFYFHEPMLIRENREIYVPRKFIRIRYVAYERDTIRSDIRSVSNRIESKLGAIVIGSASASVNGSGIIVVLQSVSVYG